jgi:predicted transcriptional regulator
LKGDHKSKIETPQQRHTRHTKAIADRLLTKEHRAAKQAVRDFLDAHDAALAAGINDANLPRLFNKARAVFDNGVLALAARVPRSASVEASKEIGREDAAAAKLAADHEQQLALEAASKAADEAEAKRIRRLLKEN